jgi:hypothetical protein
MGPGPGLGAGAAVPVAADGECGHTPRQNGGPPSPAEHSVRRHAIRGQYARDGTAAGSSGNPEPIGVGAEAMVGHHGGDGC